MLDKLAIVDIETSGTSATRDRIIEIGVVLVDKNRVTHQWSSLINPQTGVNPYILSMTGINPYELSKAPTFNQIQDEIWSYLQDRVFVAHNVRFDYGFLKSEFSYLEKTLRLPQLCTVRLSRALFPQHKGHGLDKIINRFHFKINNRHRALDDALVVWDFLLASQKICTAEQFTCAVDTIIQKPALPPRIEVQTLRNLPECPGVYLLYDELDTLLYVGKSIDIKARIKSHFYDDLRNHKELQIKQNVAKIDTITTAGELEALILEAKLIKELQPVYNHQLRRHRSLHTLLRDTNPTGYSVATYKASQEFLPTDLKSPMALFRTKRHLTSALEEVTKEHSLCKKLMGLENTSSSCFGYRLRSCLGACVDKEPIESYNARFEKAFNKLCIPYWPYQGPIALREQNQLTGQSSTMVFDQWCYIGKQDENADEINYQDMTFDYDTYKILSLYLRKNSHAIQTLNIKH